MSSKGDAATARFASGFNCSTSVFTTYCEDYDLDEETAAKIACGFGGGCATGEICGAVSGAIMVVGLKHGQESPEDQGAKTNCHAHVVEFLDRFKERKNAVTCRDLLECDPTTEEGRAIYLAKRGTVCPGLVRCSAELLEELGY